MQDDEGNRPLVDLRRRQWLNLLIGYGIDIRRSRGNAAQIEQCETEWRRQEGSLQVHGDQHPEPDQVDVHFLGHWRKYRHNDEGNFEEVDEHAENEDQQVYEDEEADLPPRQFIEQVFDPDVAISRIEGKREHRRANQDEQHKAGELGAVVQRLLEQNHRQPSPKQGHDQGANRPHCPALCRRCNPEKDCTQHQEDQHQRRNQGKGDPLCEQG